MFIEQWVDRQLWYIEAKKNVRMNDHLRSQVKEYRSSLIVREFQEQKVFNKIMIVENEVLDYYDKHHEEFISHQQSAFIEIYSTLSREAASGVLTAVKNSERPLVPAQLKLVHKGGCVEPLDKAIFANNTKSPLGPIFHAGKYYVISIIQYYPENSLLHVEHVRDDIIQKLQVAARANALQKKQKELKDHINVKIFKTSDR
ncbi:MAG: hypothetical protein K9N05_00570 [Candidatus Marinimicrobia bacterium]|nr:hypothetical protein [Candidatus Neomarinimicrobiota bacterium]